VKLVHLLGFNTKKQSVIVRTDNSTHHTIVSGKTEKKIPAS